MLEHVKLQKQIADAAAESQKKEEHHAAEIKRLQDDIERRATLHEVLKKDLEAALLEKTEAEKQHDRAKTVLKERAQND